MSTTLGSVAKSTILALIVDKTSELSSQEALQHAEL
jgi:hypothetical protein